MRHLRLGLAAALCLAGSGAVAHEFSLGALIIDHPMAFETTPVARSGGGYMTITNTGTEPDRLVEVRADFPRVQLHATQTADGVATMTHLDGIDLPPGETVALAPGGMHVMFMGLDGDPFEAGESVPATLVFEKAGEIEVLFKVEPRAGGGTDHSGHGGMADPASD